MFGAAQGCEVLFDGHCHSPAAPGVGLIGAGPELVAFESGSGRRSPLVPNAHVRLCEDEDIWVV